MEGATYASGAGWDALRPGNDGIMPWKAGQNRQKQKQNIRNEGCEENDRQRKEIQNIFGTAGEL